MSHRDVPLRRVGPRRADSLDGATPDDATLLRELAAANGFDLAALPDNRAGRLTPAQQRTLNIRLRATKRNTWIPRSIAVLAIVALGYFLARGEIGLGDAVGIAALAAAAAFAGWVAPRFARFGKDIASGVVASVEGEVLSIRDAVDPDAVAGRQSQGPAHFYRMGDNYFRVSAAGYNTLVNGRRYRIYHLPDASTRHAQALSPMVNIEPLPDLPPPPCDDVSRRVPPRAT